LASLGGFTIIDKMAILSPYLAWPAPRIALNATQCSQSHLHEIDNQDFAAVVLWIALHAGSLRQRKAGARRPDSSLAPDAHIAANNRTH
jgi:hypothetical protein